MKQTIRSSDEEMNSNESLQAITHSFTGSSGQHTANEVRESEEKYRTLFEAIDEGFCVIEVLFDEYQKPVDYRFLEVNPAFKKQTGIEEALGKRMRDLAPDHEEHWFAIYGRIALTGEAERFEQEAAALHRWYDVYAFRFGRPDQHRVGVLFNDVTSRRQHAEALRRSEERLRRALAIETVGVIFFKRDGTITEANDAFLRMNGYTREDLRRGLRLDKMTPPEWMPQSLQALAEFEAIGRTMPYEKECVRKDNSRWWGLFCAARISDDEGVEFIVDITERKQAEQALAGFRVALQESNAQLEEVVEERTARLRDVIAELHQVSYAMVHDMRAPLRAMSGFAELLEGMTDEQTPPIARDYRRRIVLAAERLDKLITDALNYTNILGEQPAIAPVDLNELVGGLIETYPNLHSDHTDVSIEGSLPVVLGNESLLTQCFSNLLGNAAKFIGPGVRPRIQIRADKPCAGAAGGADCVRIWIQDNGLGIPQNAHDRLFGIFQRFHTQFPGTGIGLAIVRKAVERMGGSVGVESEEGKGSRFWINLPLAG